MRVFISGVCGFLGSHLADAFLTRGDQVVGVDSLVGGYLDNCPQGVDLLQADCCDFERMKKTMRAVDVVYHCAATAHEGLSVFSPFENAYNGYLASVSIFSAACAVGVKRIIHMSSMARYGKQIPPFNENQTPYPEDPYGIGKYASELLLRNLAETHGIEWVIAIPHNIFGERQVYTDPFRNVISIFINLSLQNKPIFIYGDGLQERCFSYISDDVEPLVQMATAANVVGECINIGPDNEVTTILETGKLVSNILGVPFDPIFKPARPREVKIAHCSADKARTLLGYEPKINLVDGIRRTAEWIKKRGPRPFSYHQLNIEIDSPKLPETWKNRLF